MAENEILIRLGEQCWLAVYHGPHASKVINAFGSDTVPTAWLPSVRLGMVIAAIQILNPCCTVKPY